jgi:hypothetical protein
MVLPRYESDVEPHQHLDNKIPSVRCNCYRVGVTESNVSYPLTDFRMKPIVPLWGELTPRGNMVNKGVEREDGVQDQLVLGSLNSSQDLRRT